LLDKIQELQAHSYNGLIINAGAYSHSSYALYDALQMLQIPKVEVHLSNIYAREEFRATSILSTVCNGVISGFGPESYFLAMQWFHDILSQQKR